MRDEVSIFTELSREKKIEYLTAFYQSMIKKTTNPTHVAQFEKILSIVSSYDYTIDNEKRLIGLYQKIMQAKEKTKTRRLARTAVHIAQEKEKISAMENDDSADADAMLAEALSDMGL